MIPVNPSMSTRRRYALNILAAYRNSTDAQKLKGAQWYPVAHDLAEMISGGDVRKGAGVIAALSANKSWSENVKLSTRAFASGKATGHTKVTLTKATRIMNGEDPTTLLPMGLKTGNFYRSIIDPTDPEPVCVDRHAHDVAVGRIYGEEERGLSSKGRYAAIADAYRRAAKVLGMVPSELQAIVWVAHVENLRGTGTRGNNH